MRFVKNLSAAEVNAFVANSEYVHYMKTSLWAEYEADYEKYESEYVGVRDDEDSLMATALLLKKKPVLFKPYVYIPSGMCLDYENRELLDYFLKEIVSYLKEGKYSFLRVDPQVERCHRDIDGNLIEDGFDHEWITALFQENGFRHRGYGYAYNGSWMNRYTLIKDISPDYNAVLKSFSKSKLAFIKRQLKIGAIQVRHGKRDELKYLRELEFDLAKAQGSAPHKTEFFERYYDHFGDHLIYYVAEMDLDLYAEYLEKELNSKDVRSDPSQKEKREKELSEIGALKAKYGAKPVIGAGIYVYYGNKSWNLYNYKRDDFFDYQPTDLVHCRAIEELKEKGVTTYDMVGFSGSTDKNDPYYGLYYYKRRFNPRFVEHIGEFDYVFDQGEYGRFFKLRSLRGRIIRKIHVTYYKGKDRKA